MGVEQTLSKLQMHLMTSESQSWFVADRIAPARSGNGYDIIGVYSNEPHVHLRGNRSETHRGALILQTHGDSSSPARLTGEYWTDRKTTGRMTFTERVHTVFTRYEDADIGFQRGNDNVD